MNYHQLSPVILKVDMIIGRDTIKKYKLFEKIPSQSSINGLNHDDLEVGVGTNRCACQPMRDSMEPSLIAQTETLIVTPPHRILSSLIPMSLNILGGSLPDDDEIDHDKRDTFKPYLAIKTYNIRYVHYVLSIGIFLVMSCRPHQLEYLNLH